MSAEAVIFYVLATITVGSALVVTFARSLIYSAFALLFTFFGVAGLYVMLGADFLAATQLLVYVGGILVLLLFGVMLTHKLYDLDLKSEVHQFVPGLVASAGVFAVLTLYVLYSAKWAVGPGKVLLLLVALIGAAMIVRRRKDA